jgi:hypothetical protein
MYVTPDKLRAEFGESWRARVADGVVARTLTAEAAEYRAWADGDVWGYTLTTEAQCSAGEWHEVDQDSCAGFIAETDADLAAMIREHLPDGLRYGIMLDEAISARYA